MLKEHLLTWTLGAVIALNILALVVLQGRTETTEPFTPVPRVIENTRPAVETILLLADCPDCYDIERYTDDLADRVRMDVREEQGAEWDLPRLPAVAFNSTLEEYGLTADWEVVGSIVERGGQTWYVLPTLNPPYVENGTVRGIVQATLITHPCCNTSAFDKALDDAEVTYRARPVPWNSNLGRRLISRYNITLVPTLLLDREADAYLYLRPSWEVMGTIEEDAYVLREVDRMGMQYYDLDEKLIKQPAAPAR